MMQSPASQQFHALRSALQQFESGALSATALGDQARAASALLAALPERYGTVLLQLLDRCESSALFTEESCSFSRSDLLTHLQGWMDKAQSQLQQG